MVRGWGGKEIHVLRMLSLSDKIINYKAKTQLWLISENGFLLKGFYLVHRIGGNFCYKLNNILWISLRLEPPL